jgi:ABC-type transport system substrate-binding protein
MLAEVLSGLGLVADSYVSPLHPAHLAVASPIEFNPQGATQRLDQIGWLDVDAQPETPRVARGVPGVRLDTALAFTLLVPNDEYHRAVADWIVRDLTACGFGVQLRHEPASVLSAGWPDGPVFGGDFEAVLWTWPDWIVPVCEMYASWEIPDADHPFGSNALAFNDPAYDRACRQILLGPADTPAYAQALETTQVILAERAPSVPLIIAPRILATGPDICGVELTSLSRSMLWNLEAYGTGSDCE